MGNNTNPLPILIIEFTLDFPKLFVCINAITKEKYDETDNSIYRDGCRYLCGFD